MIALPASVHAADRLEGKVRLHGSSWEVADAVAFRDGKLNLFDMLRHSAQTVTLNFDTDGPSRCIDYDVRSGEVQRSGSQCDGDIAKAFSGLHNDAMRAVGTFDWQDGDNALVLRWELALTVAEGDATGGAAEALPAGGGEPGKAVLAHFAALQKGDWAAFKALAEPGRQAMMSESEARGEHLAMSELLRSFAARDVTISGDRASVGFSGTRDGSPVRGNAEVVRTGDRWYVTGSELGGGA